LDLQSTTQGLHLPLVVLTGIGDFLPGGGNKNAAKGMLVYNTGSKLDGPGLYVWTGSEWKSFAVVTCSDQTPEVPGTITFSPALSTDIVQNTTFTATVLPTVGATSYTWTVPAGFEIVSDATGRAITIKAKELATGISAAGITVKSANKCGVSGEARAGAGTINVVPCSGAPAMPTLTIPAGVYLSPGDVYTIQCGDVGADTYEWTLPAGLTPETGTTTTTVNSITVTVDEGIYPPASIRVKASRTCSETPYVSDERTGSGGTLFVEVCTPPTETYIIPLSGSKVLGANFSVTLSANTKGATTYEWSVPPGISIVSGANSMIVTLTTTAIGTYNGNNITVTATTSCGSITTSASGIFTVESPATEGEDIKIEGGNTYATMKYPLSLGTWMIENSKEGSASWETFPDKEKGERGYYYKISAAASACPAGWTAPDSIQYAALWSYLGGLSSITAENEPWFVGAGYVANNGTGNYWDQRTYYYTKEVIERGFGGVFYVNVTTKTYAIATAAAGSTAAHAVRCIKATCDDAPYVTSLTHLSPIAALGGQDTIIVSAVRSVGPVTYSWSVPAGLTILNEAPSDTLVVEYTTAGNYHWGDLKCAIRNACGTTTVTGIAAGDFSIITDTGSEGQGVIGNSETMYRTYQFPGEMGTWIIDPMQEEEYTCSAPKLTGEGNWYHYDYAKAAVACPNGWELPPATQAMAALKFARTLPIGNLAHDAWYSLAKAPGCSAAATCNPIGVSYYYMTTSTGRMVWAPIEGEGDYSEGYLGSHYENRANSVWCVSSSSR
jgi:uncharacterized protein (TIGR02145 family)